MKKSYPVVVHNIEGRYYVDESCVYCGHCVELASHNFASYQDEVAYLKKQPDCHDEHELLAEAIDACPTESIRDRLVQREGMIDDMGLGTGTTPKSILGAFAQIVLRWFSKS